METEKKEWALTPSLEAELRKREKEAASLKKKILANMLADHEMIEKHFRGQGIKKQHTKLIKRLYAAWCLYRNNYCGRRREDKDLIRKIKRIKSQATAFQTAMNDIGYAEKLWLEISGKVDVKDCSFADLINEMVFRTERALKATQHKKDDPGHPADRPRILFLMELREIYLLATGKRPGRPWRRDTGEFDGPFYRFCKPFFPPEAGSGLAKAIERALMIF